jgi:FkbH-like protein
MEQSVPTGPSVAVAASFTAFPIERPLRWWLNEVLGIDARVQVLDAGQVMQALLDPGGAFAANQGGLNVVLLRWEDWERAMPDGDAARLLASGLASASRSSPATHLVCLCPPSAGVTGTPELRGRLQDLDRRLVELAGALPGVDVVSSAELARLYPVDGYDDPHADQVAQIPYRPSLFVALAALVARRLHALVSPPCKAIVTDCDGTLWGGVCAEDGPGGVVIGEAHLALQRRLRERLEAGTLLCLASKNAEADVRAVFGRRPEMLLRWDDFVARRVNWGSKATNVRALADELGIATETVAFLDDNPLECAEVRAALPDVLTLELPPDASARGALLDGVWAFDRRPLTSEDRQRHLHQGREHERAALRASAGDLEQFLAALRLEVRIRPLEERDLVRAAQLTQRVTQLNLSGVRRSEAEIGAFQRSGPVLSRVVEVVDRFGDYGIVGLLLAAERADVLRVETFLLSCRALGRGVEHRMLAALGDAARERRLVWLELPFVETSRNRPMRDFLAAAAVAVESGPVVCYRIRSEAASAVRYVPSQTTSSTEPPTPPPATPDAGYSPAERVRRLVRIAAELSDPARMLEAFESWQRSAAERPDAEYVAPSTDVERRLAEVWAQVLGVERVGVRDVFFELGGDSLAMVQVVARALDAFGVELPVSAFFENPTVEAHARKLAELQALEGA